MSAALALHEADHEVGHVCGVCQTAIVPGERVGPCPACGSPFHAECWDENGGCASYGCPHAPAPAKEAAPAEGSSYWGQEEKVCPSCGQRIRMAALRCRFCGKVFESRAPQAAAPGRAPGRRTGRTPALLLFVCGIVPFTAPLALVVGGPALWLGWRGVRGWPATSRVLAVLGVVAAAVVTALLTVAVLLRLAAGAPVEGS